MNHARTSVLILALASMAPLAIGAESPETLRSQVLEKTKLVAVMGMPSDSKDYKGDGDPDTLEIVFLEKKSQGPSRTSEDGEVIFLYKASDKVQQQLIQKAFEIRIARAAAAASQTGS